MAAMAARPDTADERHLWLDHARGIGIILVVYAHQMRAMASAGIQPAAWNGPLQDALIYSFHMPLFFFVSGVVSVRSLRSKPFGATLRDRVKTIAYPYFLWSIVSCCLSMLATKYVNTPMGLQNLLSIAYHPILQYWFLYVLFLCQLVVLLLRRALVVAVILAVGMVIWPSPAGDPTIREFIGSFPFFVLGMVLSRSLLGTEGRWRVADPLVGLVALTAFIFLSEATDTARAAIHFAGLGQACAGIAAVTVLSRMIGNRCKWLWTLGQSSMAIFVLHTIVSAGVRTGLRVVGLTDPALILVTCVCAGILVPVAIVHLAARFGLEVWLGLGKLPKSLVQLRDPIAAAA